MAAEAAVRTVSGDRRAYPTRRVQPVPTPSPERPTVSVLVTCYNYSQFLRDSVQSALDQTGVQIDVVIVDDRSSDDSPTVAARLAEADERVRVVLHEHNLGLVPTLNEQKGALTGKYVVKLDADDLLPPGAVERAVALLEAFPRVGFVYGTAVHFEGLPPADASPTAESWTLWSGEQWLRLIARGGANVISQPEVVIRREALDQVGDYNEELPHTSDMEMWLRLACRWDVARVNGPAQGYYREHDQSMQRTVNAGWTTDLRGRLDAYESALGSAPRDMPARAELLATARHRMGRTALGEAISAYDRGRTGTVDVGELLRIAMDADPTVFEGRLGRAFEWRRRVGAERSTRHPVFVAESILRRISWEAAVRRWRRNGVWGWRGARWR